MEFYNLYGMRHLIILVSLLHALSLFSQNDSTQDEGQHQGIPTIWKKIELSFGQSVLFIPENKIEEIRNEEAIVLPTNSILFFAELRPLKKLRFPVYVNLPTESKQFLVDSVLIHERANTTGGFGAQYECFRIQISDVTRAELELGALSNMTISKRNRLRILPLFAGRIRLVKNDSFVMYIGSSYSFGIKSWALVYGTGFIF